MATLTSKLIVSLLDRVSGPARGIGASLDNLHKRASRTSSALLGGASMGGGVRNLLALGAGYVGVTKGIGGTVGAAIRFEEAFADVRKVVDGTPGQLQQIRHEILSMSKTMPTTAEGLAAIYAAAGQSNIPINELGKFSKMVAQVAVAWETTEGETSQALAEIKTQLGMSVDQISLFADAINHLGNNTAANAPKLVEYSKRVAASGEMYGFSATETLAFGSAMISAGGESEVAATSFRNMGKALTKGTQATKQNRIAFKRLGLDAVGTAKNMQKNALGTTLDVLDRIAKLPEWERISIASALFGDEARALMPVIANSTELRRQLGMVATEAGYAGSAYNEYLVRAETTGNALQVIGNKIKAVGIGWGDSWLPAIRELGLGLGDVLDTLDKRIGVFDTIGKAFGGLLAGFGYGGGGGLRQMMNDLGDLLFGEAFSDGGKWGAVDERANQLARVSNQFRDIGRNLRQFVTDIGSGDINGAMSSLGSALSEMSGGVTVTGAIAIGLTGRALLGLASGIAALALSKTGRLILAAMAIATLIDAVKEADSLGDFVDNLSALSAFDWATLAASMLLVVGPIRAIGRGASWIGRLFRGVKPPATPPTRPPAAPPGKTPTASPWQAGRTGGPTGPNGGRATPVRPAPPSLGGAAKGLLRGGLIGGALLYGGELMIDAGLAKLEEKLKQWAPGSYGKQTEGGAELKKFTDMSIIGQTGELLRRMFSGAIEAGNANRGEDMNGVWDAIRSIPSLIPPPSTGPEDVSLVGTPPVMVAGPVTTQPSGIQAVRVTNPMPAPVINVTVNATTNAAPAEIAGAVKQQISAELAALSAGAYSDG